MLRLRDPVARLERGFLSAEVALRDPGDSDRALPLAFREGAEPLARAQRWAEAARAEGALRGGKFTAAAEDEEDQGPTEEESSGIEMMAALGERLGAHDIMLRDAPRVLSGERAQRQWLRLCCRRRSPADHEDVSYTQPLGLVVGCLSLLLPGHAVVDVLDHLDGMLAGYWDPEGSSLARDALAWESILYDVDGEVASALRKLGAPPEAFCQRWFAAATVPVLPLAQCFDVLDLVITEKHGIPGLFAFGLALVEELRPLLLRARDTSAALALLHLDEDAAPATTGFQLSEVAPRIVRRARKLLNDNRPQSVRRKFLSEDSLETRRTAAERQLATRAPAATMETCECVFCRDTIPDVICGVCALCLCTECVEVFCSADDVEHEWMDFDFDSAEHCRAACAQLPGGDAASRAQSASTRCVLHGIDCVCSMCCTCTTCDKVCDCACSCANK
jgi:Rab-GTPase-TBC domain